jgi:hypothetical protein
MDGPRRRAHSYGSAGIASGGGLRLKDGPGSARAVTVRVWLRWGRWRVRANVEDAEHQGDEDPENRHAGLAPGPRVWLRSSAFSPPTVLRGRGRIFPAPARENPAPQFGSLGHARCVRSDSHPGCLTATQRQVAIPADLRLGSSARTS